MCDAILRILFLAEFNTSVQSSSDRVSLMQETRNIEAITEFPPYRVGSVTNVIGWRAGTAKVIEVVRDTVSQFRARWKFTPLVDLPPYLGFGPDGPRADDPIPEECLTLEHNEVANLYWAWAALKKILYPPDGISLVRKLPSIPNTGNQRIIGSNHERDEFMRKMYSAGESLKAIRQTMNGMARSRGWVPLESDQGVYQAIKRYCERTELPLLSHRKSPPKRH
jgi:hypothetical protein